VHEWMGLNAYAKKRADQLAELGISPLLLTFMERGIRPKDTTEAGQFAESTGLTENCSVPRECCIQVLNDQDLTDLKRTAAIATASAEQRSWNLHGAGPISQAW